MMLQMKIKDISYNMKWYNFLTWREPKSSFVCMMIFQMLNYILRIKHILTMKDDETIWICYAICNELRLPWKMEFIYVMDYSVMSFSGWVWLPCNEVSVCITVTQWRVSNMSYGYLVKGCQYDSLAGMFTLPYGKGPVW
jgi:hypothetical protein